MQNFFLSPALGRPADSKGLVAQQQQLQYAIPAARKTGIRIIWLNWGLTDEDLVTMPPSTTRAFGFETVSAEQFESWANIEAKQAAIDSHGVNEGCHKFGVKVESSGKNTRIYQGLGTDIGPIDLGDGTSVEAGRLLMRDSWNADLTPELRAAYEEGPNASPPDVWMHKNRMSGLWGASTDCTEFLEKEGIKTLLFAGVNTDQCVGGSLQDVSNPSIPCPRLFHTAHPTLAFSPIPSEIMAAFFANDNIWPGLHQGLRHPPPIRWRWHDESCRQPRKYRVQLC
jgi:nicotinamidase-related amidase